MHDIHQLIQKISDRASTDVSALPSEDADAYLSRVARGLEMFASEVPSARRVFVLRAPGRVNLIGEHTDYNGLPVLPIAIDRDIILIGAPRDDAEIRILNTNESFGPRRFGISDDIESYPPGDWGNYPKAAAQSLSRHFSSRNLRGFDAVIDGDIPIASGLSSSSALVVAFALAILAANNLEMDRLQLAELLARAEQYVGTRGGGMDQAICLLATAGHALEIDFFPLRTRQVPLPSGHRLVVCHSLVVAPKALSTRFAYNLRAAESRIAAALLGRALAGRVGRNNIAIERLGDLFSDELKLSNEGIDSLVQTALLKEAYTPVEAAHLLGLEPEDFRRQHLVAFDEAEARSITQFKPRARARHVISEGRRVRRAAEALRNDRAEKFGRLMNESHRSCANDYEVSTPELDTLVAIARDAGALGARLTGAGFGGCTINLVREADIDGFVRMIQKKYYREYITEKRPDLASSANLPERIFVCNAVGAAGELSL